MTTNLNRYEIRLQKYGTWYGITLQEALNAGMIDEVKMWLSNHLFKSCGLKNGVIKENQIIEIIKKIEIDGYSIPTSNVSEDDFIIKK